MNMRSLAQRDPALPDLLTLLDDTLRADALGTPTRITRLRYKPGASAVAALRDARGAISWAATYSDPVKLHKSRVRARRAAAELVSHGSILAGPVHADRLLARPLRAGLGDHGAVDSDEIVRYNPLRRLVLQRDDHAVRVTAETQHGDVDALLAARGVPTIPVTRLHAHVSRSPWWGHGDLSARTDGPALLARVGEALAHLHAVELPAGTLATFDAPREARRAAEAVATLLPEAAPRARALAERVSALTASGEPVTSHGDFSPDQVLTDGAELRLIDFDRAVLAPREHDLGSHLSVDGDPALLDGYRAAGGRIDERALAGWHALARLRRAVDPFRTAAPDWSAQVAARLAIAEGVVRSEA